MLIIYLGLAVFYYWGNWFLIAAFKNSILWGLGCLLLYPVSIIFLILNWSEAKNPFFSPTTRHWNYVNWISIFLPHTY